MQKNKLSFRIRPGYPDFLDLPWDRPLSEWSSTCSRIVELEKGLSRHTVVFAEYAGNIYALKELHTPSLAEEEYENLRKMKELEIPSVEPVGWVVMPRQGLDESYSILITVYLNLSLPYRALLMNPGSERYFERLISSMVSLFVKLHLKGIFWGDCSLSNVLFKRDAGELSAHLVDAETTRFYESLSTGRREEDLMIMEENISGDLSDLGALGVLPSHLDPLAFVGKIIERYNWLWGEIDKEVIIHRNERYKIQERIRALNQMGFSVDEITLEDVGDRERLKMKTIVTDQHYHRHVLHNLTGLVGKDHESRILLNDIKELNAHMSQMSNRSIPLSVTAFHWMHDVFQPVMGQLQKDNLSLEDMTQLYCQVLEHKWYISEKAGKDVGMEATLVDFKNNILPKIKESS